MKPLPAWLEDARSHELDELPAEIIDHLRNKRCPHCGEAEHVRINGVGVYVCLSPACMAIMAPRYAVALWWKFDPARDGGKGKDHASKLLRDRPTRGERVERADAKEGGPWRMSC